MKRKKTVWFEHQTESTWRPDYPECSMYRYLVETSSKWPDLYALQFEGKKTSFSELIEQIKTVAKSFVGMGIQAGDFVTIISPNTPQAVVVFYALNSIGAVANLLHPMLSPPEIKKAIAETDSKLILVLDMFEEKVQDLDVPIVNMYISDALPTIKSKVYRLFKENAPLKGLPWKAFLKLGQKQAFVEHRGTGDDLATIMYSGGTSGESKGVMLTNRNFNALAIQSYDTMGIADVSGMKCLSILPIFHGTGLGITVHSMLTNGICSVLIPKFDPEKTCKLIFKEKIEYLFGVPAFYEALTRCPEIETKSCSFLTVIGSCGDKLPEKVRHKMNRFLEKSNAPYTLTNGYGMTECTAGCCYEPYFGKKPGTSGIMNPDNLCKIVEPGTEHALSTGEIGELCIAGPIVMKGYYKRPEETAKTLRTHQDGLTWLHTGDAFSIDEDGFLTFHQRLDRMFIISGFNIYPSNIEDVILSVPGVSQCCVVGKEIPIVGRKIVAFVVGSKSSVNKIRKACMDNLPEFSQPAEIIFLDEFPKTKLNKINYIELERIAP